MDQEKIKEKLINNFEPFIGKKNTKENRDKIVEVAQNTLDEEYDGSYCPVCDCCGHDGCCPIEISLLKHGCTFAEDYAREVYLNKMIIDEFHNFVKDQVAYCTFDKPGDVVMGPIDLVYKRAFDRVEEKYGKAN
jgi:hypothetical protein